MSDANGRRGTKKVTTGITRVFPHAWQTEVAKKVLAKLQATEGLDVECTNGRSVNVRNAGMVIGFQNNYSKSLAIELHRTHSKSSTMEVTSDKADSREWLGRLVRGIKQEVKRITSSRKRMQDRKDARQAQKDDLLFNFGAFNVKATDSRLNHTLNFEEGMASISKSRMKDGWRIDVSGLSTQEAHKVLKLLSMIKSGQHISL